MFKEDREIDRSIKSTYKHGHLSSIPITYIKKKKMRPIVVETLCYPHTKKIHTDEFLGIQLSSVLYKL